MFRTSRPIVKLLFLTCLVFSVNLTLTTATLGYEDKTSAEPVIDTGRISALILLTGNNPTQLNRVKEIILTNNGHITHTFPNRAMIVNIPPNLEQHLAALDEVLLVATETIDLARVDIYGPEIRRYAGLWNHLIAPEIQETTIAAAQHPDESLNDALVAPDLPPGELGAAATSITPGYYQTSEYMAGTVAVGIVLVESDGTTDPSTENWTDDEKQQVLNEIVGAFNWWAEMEPRAHLSFVYQDHASQPLPTTVEPITHPYYYQRYWIGDAMRAIGHNATSYITQVRDYNNDLRNHYQTDWAFTIFVVDSSADGDNRFSDGYFAYAYLGGPFMVMTYGNNGYGPGYMDAVAAHEIGHIFLALDQYYNAYQPCTRRAGYLNVENQNSLYGSCTSHVNSIMRGQIYPYTGHALDPYAAGQIGWRDSDDDNILDPLDTELPITIDTLTQNDNTVTVSGSTQIIPYPSLSRIDATINTLTGVQYRLNQGVWQTANATDGHFDSTTETYHFTVDLPPGLHELEVAAIDSAGNVSAHYATETIIIIDPIDGGLYTQLYSPDAPLPTGKPVTLNGIAYHLADGIVTNVEYRLDDGPTMPADTQDGAFDSNHENFSVILDSLESGTHHVEVFATDNMGHTETNAANLELQVVDTRTIFLPLIMH